jgi:hypothetical protein
MMKISHCFIVFFNIIPKNILNRELIKIKTTKNY